MSIENVIQIISIEGKFLTVVSILVGLWWPYILEIKHYKIENSGINAGNYNDKRQKMKRVLYAMVLPLLIVNLILSIFFFFVSKDLLVLYGKNLYDNIIIISEIGINCFFFVFTIIMLNFFILLFIRIYNKKKD